MVSRIKKQLEKIPDAPGIYLFYDAKKELVYVGKATSLRSRVRSYWNGKKTPRPIEIMLHEVVDVKWKEAESVLEAIILEANYIKKYQPKYNVIGKDNKSWNYIVITKDAYPRIETFRQHQFETLVKNKKGKEKQFLHVFGPYPGLNTKATMKLLRKLFQFSTCRPPGDHPKGGNPKKYRPCLYRQMGQCLGVCTGDISASEYKKKVINPLARLLRGQKKQLVRDLEKRMKVAAKAEDFEEAARLRNQISSLQRIQDVALLNKGFFDIPEGAGRDRPVRESKNRIEGYDISNLGPTGVVGAMVVFIDGEPSKSNYRKFKIKSVEGQSDVGALAEMLQRRLRHDEWPLPDVFLIDGGKPQVNRAKKVLKEMKIDRPVVGIAKGSKRKKNEFILGSKKADFVRWVANHQQTLIKVRDEAHRFAIQYQRRTRKI